MAVEKDKRRSPGRGGMVIPITQEAINAAVVRDSSHCVIADAVRAALPHVRLVSVDLQTIRWSDPKSRRRYVFLTPVAAQVALVNFDQGVKPEPFNLRLTRPAQIVKMNVNDRKKRKPGTHDRNLPEGTKKATHAPRSHGAVPTVVGGQAPPTAALSNTRGRVRTFGLRTLQQ